MLLAETIMQTTVSTIDSAIDASVFRGRVDALEDVDLPCVAVFQGAEVPAGENGRLNLAFMDQLLAIRTEVAARSSYQWIETDLNELRRQVHAVLMAENALSLAYVIDIIPDGVEEPVIDGTSDKYTGTMVLNWLVHYRHQQNDAGAAP